METIAPGAEPNAVPARLPGLGGDPAAVTETPASLVSPVPLPKIGLSGIGRAHQAAVVVLLAALATALLLLFGSGPLRSSAAAFKHVRWGFLPALVALSVLHYILAAVALSGAAGRRLPLYEATLTQFTAAAANRITPGGLGAAAVNIRYLVRRGLPLTAAAGAVAVLHVAGLSADLLLMAAVLALGGADERMMDAMGSHAAHAADLVPEVPPVPLVAAAGLLVPIAVLGGRRVAHSAAVGRAVSGFAGLCRRPRDLAIAMGASAGTTFVLGLAFAISVLAMPGATAGPGDMLALVAAFVVGAAAGAAIPVPGGIGSTEAALVAALTALGIPAGPALQAVLLFRAITFWAPVPVGLLACRLPRR